MESWSRETLNVFQEYTPPRIVYVKRINTCHGLNFNDAYTAIGATKLSNEKKGRAVRFYGTFT